MAKTMDRTTPKDAMVATYTAWKRYGDQPFAVTGKGPMYPALRHAERLGWIWFPNPSTASVTQSGRRVLADYGVPQ